MQSSAVKFDGQTVRSPSCTVFYGPVTTEHVVSNQYGSIMCQRKSCLSLRHPHSTTCSGVHITPSPPYHHSIQAGNHAGTTDHGSGRFSWMVWEQANRVLPQPQLFQHHEKPFQVEINVNSPSDQCLGLHCTHMFVCAMAYMYSNIPLFSHYLITGVLFRPITCTYVTAIGTGGKISWEATEHSCTCISCCPPLVASKQAALGFVSLCLPQGKSLRHDGGLLKLFHACG